MEIKSPERTSLLFTFLYSLRVEQIYIWGLWFQLCFYSSADHHMYLWVLYGMLVWLRVHGEERNLMCPTQEYHLPLLRHGFSLAWSLPRRLDWLPKEPQGSCLCLFSARITYMSPQPETHTLACFQSLYVISYWTYPVICLLLPFTVCLESYGCIQIGWCHPIL